MAGLILSISMITYLLGFALLILLIYIAFLAIKVLKIYINKNQ